MNHIAALRRMLLAAACGLLLMLTAGCWDDAEINGRAFVLGFGMDEGGRAGESRFTFELAIPVSGESVSSGTIEYTLCTVDAVSPGEAIRRLEKDLGRQVNFEQINLILVGEGLARRGFLDMTGYFFNRASVRRQSCIASCEGSAKEFFSAYPARKAVSTDAAIALQSYGSQGGGRSVSMNLHSLFRTVSNAQPFLLLRLSPAEKDKAFISISGAAAFGSAGEFQGLYSPDEVELIRLLCGCREGGTLTLNDGGTAPRRFRTGDSSCSGKCEIRGGRPEFLIRLDLLLLPDTGEHSHDIPPATEDAAAAALTGRLESLAARCRNELGTPAPGLLDILRQRQPEWYDLHEERAEEYCRQAKVRFRVRCKIVEGGIIQ